MRRFVIYTCGFHAVNDNASLLQSAAPPLIMTRPAAVAGFSSSSLRQKTREPHLEAHLKVTHSSVVGDQSYVKGRLCRGQPRRGSKVL